MENTEGGRSRHVSIRVPSELWNGLAKEAKRRRVTINTLSNLILDKYLEFDRIVDHMHGVVVERRVFAEILKKVEANDLREIGR